VLANAQECLIWPDCPGHPFYVPDEETGVCFRKVIGPVELPEFFGTFFLPFIVAVITPAGLPSGPAIVAITVSLFGFPIKEALGISVFSLLCQTLIRFVFKIRLLHPKGRPPLINYKLAAACFPLMAIGCFIGVIIVAVVPSIVVIVLNLLIVLAISVYALVKAILLFKLEGAIKVA